VGQNTRQLFKLILFICAIASFLVWAVPPPHCTAVLAIRVIAPLGILGMSYVVWKVSRMPGKLPDHLARIRWRYFERTGLAFAPTFEVEGGIAWLCFYFQNRYEREVNATIVMQAGLRSFRVSRYSLATQSVSIRCAGGAFGVARLPMPIPANLQGRKATFEVAADVKYPKWRGKLLHMCAGLRTGPTRNLSQTVRLLDALLFGMFFGILHANRPAQVSLVLPTGVSEQPPADRQRSLELLWQPPIPESSPSRLAA